MEKRFWPWVFVLIAVGCGDRAEFQTTTDTAPAVAPTSEDSQAEDDGGFANEADGEIEVDDDGAREERGDRESADGSAKEDEKSCDAMPALPANCELTADLQILCKDVTLTTARRIDGEWVWTASR